MLGGDDFIQKSKGFFILGGFEMKDIFCRVILLSVVFTCFLSRISFAAQGATENVIILTIDGIRYDEVVKEYMPFTLGGIDPNTGNPVPNPLIKEGSFYTNFYNTGKTSTTPAHQTILTGVRQTLTNNGALKTRQRTKEPNVFEYYRKGNNLPRDKTWIIAGKLKQLTHADYSLHPGYGYYYRSSYYRGGGGIRDEQIFKVTKEKMDLYKPSLMLINLALVDNTAHKGVYADYTNAITLADKIVYDLWQKIQNDPHYQNKTTLFITTDHGRHSDGIETGFVDHGGHSRGDRHLLFLALGPDIKQNTVINTRRDQIDIAPTIGELLGFQTPYAEGSIMDEIFSNPDLGNNTITGGLRKPKVAVNGDGIHLVWSGKNGQEWDIYYKMSTDSGLTWSAPLKLFVSDKDNSFYEADITAGAGWVYVTATGYSVMDLGGPTYVWRLYGGKTLSSGMIWDPPEVIFDLGKVLGKPIIRSSGDEISIIVGENGRELYSFNGTYFNTSGLRQARMDNSTSNKSKNIVSYTLARNHQDTFAIWPAVYNSKIQVATALQKKWNLYFNRYDQASSSWGNDDVITDNTVSKQFFYDPVADLNDKGLFRLVWAGYTDTRGSSETWGVFLQATKNGGNRWTPLNPKRLSNTAIHSWNPEITFLKDSEAKTLVIWQAYQNGASEIQGIVKKRGNWGSILDLTLHDGIDSAKPDIAAYRGKAYMSWQDMGSGNWDVEFMEVDVNQ